MILRRVVGGSMLPTLKEGQIVVATNKIFRKGNVVIARVNGRDLVKRIIAIKPKIILKGDNPGSASYEGVNESDILGIVIWPVIKR